MKSFVMQIQSNIQSMIKNHQTVLEVFSKINEP